MSLRRRKLDSRRPIGADGAGRWGRRHRNKYAVSERAPLARPWCDASDSLKRHCWLVAGHPGPHAFAEGKR